MVHCLGRFPAPAIVDKTLSSLRPRPSRFPNDNFPPGQLSFIPAAFRHLCLHRGQLALLNSTLDPPSISPRSPSLTSPPPGASPAPLFYRVRFTVVAEARPCLLFFFRCFGVFFSSLAAGGVCFAFLDSRWAQSTVDFLFQFPAGRISPDSAGRCFRQNLRPRARYVLARFFLRATGINMKFVFVNGLNLDAEMEKARFRGLSRPRSLSNESLVFCFKFISSGWHGRNFKGFKNECNFDTSNCAVHVLLTNRCF